MLQMMTGMQPHIIKVMRYSNQAENAMPAVMLKKHDINSRIYSPDALRRISI